MRRIVCSACGLEKTEDQFFRNVSKRNGRCSDCKVCYIAARVERKSYAPTWQYEQPPEVLQWLRRPLPEICND